MTSGIDLIKAERERQIKQEGWTDRHDNGHPAGELEAAGEFYIHQGTAINYPWPWGDPPKLKDQRSNHIRGGALLMAEVDRIDRVHIMRPPTCSFDVRNADRDNMTRLKRRIQWVADRLDGIPTSQEKADALTKAYAEGGYPAFVRAAWMQPTHDDSRSRTIAALGLMGESGEVCEVIKKRVRGDVGEHVSDAKLIAELGDVLFYGQLIDIQFGLNVNLEANLMGGDQVYGAVGLCEMASGIAKAIINNRPVFRGQLTALNCFIGMAAPQNISLSDIAKTNVEKLTKRILAQGDLRGTGSDR